MREVGDVDDEDLRQAFHNYTQLMLDLAMISENAYGLDPKVHELLQVYEQRISLMKRSFLFKA